VWIALTPERIVTLSPRVQRITCGNGSMMTGPGTNTYLIGSPGHDEVAVLDPGPRTPTPRPICRPCWPPPPAGASPTSW
jgi:hypothetical protein